jgi:hypothetical protein
MTCLKVAERRNRRAQAAYALEHIGILPWQDHAQITGNSWRLDRAPTQQFFDCVDTLVPGLLAGPFDSRACSVVS